MNYLAHAYLSFDIPAVLAGNLISDYVKGKKQYDFAADVRKGIVLHRAIDTFTDGHEATAIAKEVFRPAYRLYSGAFVDVVYDHFLARDTQVFDGDRLFDFSQAVYNTLDQYVSIFPQPFRLLYPYMKAHNWLYNYRNRVNIDYSFQGVVRRAMYLKDSSEAYRLFEKHYTMLQECYDVFFPAVKAFAWSTLESLNNEN